MPAAAVIPAPIAYIKVAAVKKLVVGSRVSSRWSCSRRYCLDDLTNGCKTPSALHWVLVGGHCVYCEKIRVFKAGYFGSNSRAWNNGK